MPRTTSIAIIAALAAGGCASQTALSGEVRSGIDEAFGGRVVALRQSHYFGDLYDDNEWWMLSPYPFDEISHIVDLDDRPIHPAGQRGIVPAGTRFVIEEVEFPDSFALLKRMLTTPRYNPWVYLRPLDGDLNVFSQRHAMILPLPMDMPDRATVEDALARLFGTPKEVNAWLAARRPTVRVAITHKDVVDGMSVEELTAAMGPPRAIFDDESKDGAVQVAWYQSREAFIKEDRVVEVRMSRRMEPAEAAALGR